MSKVIFTVLAAALVLAAVLVVRQMQNTASDSKDAEIAAKLREELFGWFQDKKEYPVFLEQIWSRSNMRNYRAKYNIPDERLAIFSYKAQSNWYELSFTNFGVIQFQIGSNGSVIR